MNYAEYNIKIKSNWFERGIIKTIGYKGYALYLNFFRFHVRRQEHEYTFIVSISSLRKETGYTSNEIFDLIKLMVKCKIIDTNITRWDRMYENGELITDKLFIVWACDVPQTTRVKETRNGKEVEIDKPNTKEDYYASINFDMMQHYKNKGLNERYYILYALIRKLSNGTEHKSWMSINNMAELMGIGDNYVHKMIYNLNREYLLASVYKKVDGYTVYEGKKVQKKRFEHHILGNLKHEDRFITSFKTTIDANVKKWNKRDKKKSGKVEQLAFQSEIIVEGNSSDTYDEINWHEPDELDVIEADLDNDLYFNEVNVF